MVYTPKPKTHVADPSQPTQNQQQPLRSRRVQLGGGGAWGRETAAKRGVEKRPRSRGGECVVRGSERRPAPHSLTSQIRGRRWPKYYFPMALQTLLEAPTRALHHQSRRIQRYYLSTLWEIFAKSGLDIPPHLPGRISNRPQKSTTVQSTNERSTRPTLAKRATSVAVRASAVAVSREILSAENQIKR